MNLWHLFYQLDLGILHLINVGWENPLMDRIWLILTHLERQWWFVLIVMPLILIRLFYIYRLRAFKPLAMVGLAVALADLLSYHVVKFIISRPRPFDNPEIAGWLRHVGDAHGPSFPSNHAANCFAGAMVLAWYFPSARDLFYILALLIGYSRIALGVHYPSDVVGGAILGILVGLLVRVLLLTRFKFLRLGKSVSSSDGNSYSWRKRIRRLEED